MPCRKVRLCGESVGSMGGLWGVCRLDGESVGWVGGLWGSAKEETGGRNVL